MSNQDLLSELVRYKAIELGQSLHISRQSSDHGPSVGSAAENDWQKFFRSLPKRYDVTEGFVVSSDGEKSPQLDLIVHDSQYSPLVFSKSGINYVPVESVYAIFEVKQSVSVDGLRQIKFSACAVRSMNRRYSPVRIINKDRVIGEPNYILSGILALSSGYQPPMSKALQKSMIEGKDVEKIDLCCVAEAGYCVINREGEVRIETGQEVLGNFAFELMAELQREGTVGPIDIRSYTRHLND